MYSQRPAHLFMALALFLFQLCQTDLLGNPRLSADGLRLVQLFGPMGDVLIVRSAQSLFITQVRDFKPQVLP
jgi:hypothetical protein